jgi:predicted HicB family RNase H-like nuclease
VKKIQMKQIEAGPDGAYDAGSVRYLEDAAADARIKVGAAVEVKDGSAAGAEASKPPKKETPSEKKAREQKEQHAAAKAKAEAENVAKGLNPDGSEKK